MVLFRGIIALVCGLAVAIGLLWIGQGLGLINWPSDSFMLADRRWAFNGLVLAAAGFLGLFLMRRRGRPGQ